MAGITSSSLFAFYKKLSAFIFALFSKNAHSKFAKILLKAAGKRCMLIKTVVHFKNFLQRLLVKINRSGIVAEL